MGGTIGRIGAGIATGGASELTGAETLANGLPGGGGGKKSAPAPPDFGALADKQTAANRPNQSTPYGSSTWDPTHTTQTTNFAPGIQGANDSMQSQLSSTWSKPLDNGESARTAASNALYSQATSRLDPLWNQREQATNASLANMGLDPGSEAGQAQLGNFNRARNDAYGSAENSAVAGGANAAAQQQQLDLNARNAPLQGMEGLKSLLQMPGYGQAGDQLGAGQAGFNAAMQQFNANGGSLGGFGQLLQALGPLIMQGGKMAATGGAGGGGSLAGSGYGGASDAFMGG